MTNNVNVARLDAGVSLRCCCNILAAAAIVFGPSAAAAGKTADEPFSVWFRAEPGLPRRKDMREDKLNRLIGLDYDPMWMSKTPVVSANGVGGINVTTSDTATVQAAGPDHIQLPKQLPAQYQEIVRSWLLHRASCPVEFTWTDLGKSFWPRWIRTGRCGRSETPSCSWPPGMSCMQTSVRVLNLLRWHCWLKNRKSKRKKQERKTATALAVNNTTATGSRRGGGNGNGKRAGKKKKNDDKFRCLWIKVPYPVTEDCTCSCRKSDE
ncbi:Cystine-knot cytokine [Cinara cedri]|uniref:Cystine-knot cytokine n=1 Tax=Cinara cedri TaxID=506608 RepID=A0A5E4MN83_9HEMI|nr:Cystine-knot cytokine [Cinara cedri]